MADKRPSQSRPKPTTISEDVANLARSIKGAARAATHAYGGTTKTLQSHRAKVDAQNAAYSKQISGSKRSK